MLDFVEQQQVVESKGKVAGSHTTPLKQLQLQ